MSKIDFKKYLDKKYLKIYIPVLVGLVVVVGLIVGLAIAGNQNEPENTTPEATTPDNTVNNTPTEKDYTLAIGVVVAKDLEGLKLDETVATIVTDADGKIVLCRLDCLSYTAKFTDGVLNTTAPASKVVLGDNYMMPSGSWANQTAELEKFVVGKTQAEVAAIALNGGKLTDAEISASCTFVVTDLLKAIDNAFNSTAKVTFKTASTNLTAGLSALGTVSGDATNVKLVADFAGAVLADGAVVASILDCAEVEFQNIGETGAEKDNFTKTKREQGDSYMMTSGSWATQADAFAASAAGKTAANIEGLAIEGVAGCTMPYSPASFKTAIVAAVKAAR